VPDATPQTVAAATTVADDIDAVTAGLGRIDEALDTDALVGTASSEPVDTEPPTPA
jgi:hypothetical protein